VREFQKIRTLLFDGESALRSAAAQRDIQNKLQIKVHAEPYWKRSLAERAIGEIKLRMAIHLDYNGKINLSSASLHKLNDLLFRISIKQMER
jgi:predicted acetyltransferase